MAHELHLDRIVGGPKWHGLPAVDFFVPRQVNTNDYVLGPAEPAVDSPPEYFIVWDCECDICGDLGLLRSGGFCDCESGIEARKADDSREPAALPLDEEITK